MNQRAKMAINRSLATARQQKTKPPAPITSFWNRLEAVDYDELDEEFLSIKQEVVETDETKEEPIVVEKHPPVKRRIRKRKFLFSKKSGKPFKKPRQEIVDEKTVLIRKGSRGRPRKNSLTTTLVEENKETFGCEFCATTFAFYAQFKSHDVNCALRNEKLNMAQTYMEIVYKCTACGNIYETFLDYLKHFDDNDQRCVDHSKIRLAGWDACVCVLCGFTTRRSTMLDHLREDHLKELRNLEEDYFQQCRLCASRSLLKSGKFMSALEFFNHLSCWHPAALTLLKIDDEETEGFDLSSAKMTCRLCDAQIAKHEFDNHVLLEHCGDEFVDDGDEPKSKKLLYDPMLRKRRRAESPPPPFPSDDTDKVDRETVMKYRRRRVYRWSQVKEKEKRRCTSCGWIGDSRTEYVIHVLCNLCKAEYNEGLNSLMKCGLCASVVERTEILTHLYEMHEYELGVVFNPERPDENYANESILAHEIIGHDWICPHCFVGFEREAKSVKVGHRCRRKLSSNNSYSASEINSKSIRICPFCRARLKNDVLLKLHHRFEHDDARSGLEDGVDDPNYIYTALESTSEKVRDFVTNAGQNLTKREISFSTMLRDETESNSSYKCKCGAAFNAFDVFRQHCTVFHSKLTSMTFDDVASKLFRCDQTQTSFDVRELLVNVTQASPLLPKTSSLKRPKNVPSTFKMKKLSPKVVPSNSGVPGIVIQASESSAGEFLSPRVVTVEHGDQQFVKSSLSPPPSSLYSDMTTTMSISTGQQKRKVAPPVVINAFSLMNPNVKQQVRQVQSGLSYINRKPSPGFLKQSPTSVNNNAKSPTKNTTIIVNSHQSPPKFNLQQQTTPLGLSVVNPVIVGSKPLIINASAASVPRVIHVVNSGVNNIGKQQQRTILPCGKTNANLNVQITQLPSKEIVVSCSTTQKPQVVVSPIQNAETTNKAGQLLKGDVLGAMLQNQQKVIRIVTPKTTTAITRPSSSIPSVTVVNASKPIAAITTAGTITVSTCNGTSAIISKTRSPEKVLVAKTATR